jgi:mRNA interferase RelE/StbE
MDAIDLLADEPRPGGTAEYGSPDLRRMHVGRYRVLYEITEETITIVIIHVGRIG